MYECFMRVCLYVCPYVCVYLCKKFYAIQPLMGCDVKISINHLSIYLSIYIILFTMLTLKPFQNPNITPPPPPAHDSPAYKHAIVSMLHSNDSSNCVASVHKGKCLFNEGAKPNMFHKGRENVGRQCFAQRPEMEVFF